MVDKHKKRRAAQYIGADLLRLAFSDFVDSAAAKHKQTILNKHQTLIQKYGLTEQDVLKAAKQLLRNLASIIFID